MKVVLVNHSDINGGAAIVTYRLTNALRRAGVDANMLVYTRYYDDPSVQVVSTRLRRSMAFYLERLAIYRKLGYNRKNLFKISTASVGVGLTQHPLVREADIVVLSWINQGLMSLSDLRKLGKMGKKVVWIMHDMWPMTGICHHSLDCSNYEEKCGNCHFLGYNRSPEDLSRKVWEKKNSIYYQMPITYVAVSNWLGKIARKSSLLKNKDVEVIHNAFPIESFSTETTSEHLPIDLPSDKRYIIMGAARLDDPIKGLPIAIDSLNIIFDTYPVIANSCEALFFGNIKDPAAFDNLRFPYRHIGQINDEAILRNVYAKGTVVISSSHYETLPGTLIEGMASGCLAVSFGMGGQADIIDHLKTGYIAKYKNVSDFAEGIMWALRQDVDRNELHNEVGRRFSSDIIAKKYIALFNRLISEKKTGE